MAFALNLDLRNSANERQNYTRPFFPQNSCVVISQNWPECLNLPDRYFPVFTLPGVFESGDPLELQSLEFRTQEDGEPKTFVLQWAQLPAQSFEYETIFEAITNADHAQSPSAAGDVYFLNPAKGIIVHMYDDRGMDVIAASKAMIMPIYRTFSDWVLEFDRELIAKRLS